MAQRTGLEPATPGVTGRYSNQLNYHCTVADSDDIGWWVVTDSNRRHSACKADALPTELTTLIGDTSQLEKAMPSLQKDIEKIFK